VSRRDGDSLAQADHHDGGVGNEIAGDGQQPNDEGQRYQGLHQRHVYAEQTQHQVEVHPREESVDQRNPELREHYALKRGGETRGVAYDFLAERAAFIRARGFLHRQQRADDHAEQHMHYAAADTPARELQRSGVGP